MLRATLAGKKTRIHEKLHLAARKLVILAHLQARSHAGILGRIRPEMPAWAVRLPGCPVRAAPPSVPQGLMGAGFFPPGDATAVPCGTAP